MKVRIQVIVESDHGATQCVEDVAEFERGALQPDALGLTLAEAKALLQGVQRTIVAEQTTAYLEAHRPCPACQAPRRCKGHHPLVYRTVFGKLTLPSPRWYMCRCQTTEPRRFSPLAELLQEHTAPELLYLEAKFAALMSYGVTVNVLGELLPMGAQLNATTVQRHLLRVAERVEQELGEEQVMFVEGCPAEWEDLPAPDAPLTVGLDGGCVHARDERRRKAGWFEVIAGKSIPAEGAAKCFGFVHTYDTKPKRRLFEVLRSQGLQENQQVTFLADGGDTVRDLPMYLHPEAEHLLDWFHISMRVTVIGQMAKGLTAQERTDASRDVEKQLERVKWYLWHGNVFRALQGLEDLAMDLDDIEPVTEGLKKLRKAMHEFQGYIAVNKLFIPNDGDRYRHGETISTAFVESTVNQVVSRRMVKQQQMRWTQRGAHLLLQVRTQALNDDLRATFGRWYPGIQRGIHQEQDAA
jgi:hypothetical protein